MKIFGIIPARYASRRFPGKSLALINGKPMIQRVYEQAVKCEIFSGVVVATDDQRILQCVENFGGKACMTSADHRSGTERCNEAKSFFGKIKPDDIILDIQGDEPFIDPRQLEQLADCFRMKDVFIATLVKKIRTSDELTDPNVVKVIRDKKFNAIYFSRTPLPYYREREASGWTETGIYFKHIGLYGYRSGTLSELVRLPESVLEKAESLEQLRWIENGYRIHTAETDIDTLAIDSPSDLSKITNTTG